MFEVIPNASPLPINKVFNVSNLLVTSRREPNEFVEDLFLSVLNSVCDYDIYILAQFKNNVTNNEKERKSLLIIKSTLKNGLLFDDNDDPGLNDWKPTLSFSRVGVLGKYLY